MPTTIEPQDIEAFYRAALIGLRFLDDQQERRSRFGADADARWASFRGHLGTADRIKILCRDAAVTYGVAFAPARIFGLEGVAPDEAFGPTWPRLEEREARRAWADAEGAAPWKRASALSRISEVLGVSDAPVEGLAGGLVPSSKVLAGGGAAVRTLASAFLGDDALRWAEQVVVIADQPCERQLAGLAAVLLATGRETKVAAVADLDALRERDTKVVSADAGDAVRRAVRGVR